MFSLTALAAAMIEAPPGRPLFGQQVVLGQWRAANNRAECAPLAFARNGGVPGSPRAADFGGGWGVAFDGPRQRSAYGVAGTGLLESDNAPHAEKRAALRRQWPYTRELGRSGGLPGGSFAGYGREGARRYSASAPAGRGQHSLAYVRIPGQACLYNVWSRVSRAHLEALLDSLRLVPAPTLPPSPRPPLVATEPTFASWIARLRPGANQRCTVNSRTVAPCSIRRDGKGTVELRVGGREPLLAVVDPDGAALFAVVGHRNVPLMVRYRPHPGALNCLWAEERDAPISQICVGAEGAGR